MKAYDFDRREAVRTHTNKTYTEQIPTFWQELLIADYEYKSALHKAIIYYICYMNNSFSSCTLRELCVAFYLYDSRTIREAIEDLREDFCIVNLQDGNGYILVNPDTDKGQELIEKWWVQETNRAIANFKHLKGAKKHRKNPHQIDFNAILYGDGSTHNVTD